MGAPPPGDPDGTPPPDVPPDPLPGAWATAGDTRKKLTTASAMLCLHMVLSPDASVRSRWRMFLRVTAKQVPAHVRLSGKLTDRKRENLQRAFY